MLEMFRSGAFTAAAAILASTGLGVFVRTASRNDSHKSFILSDFSVGLEILIAMIGVLTAQSIEYFSNQAQINAYELSVCLNGLVVLMIVLWGVSTAIRKMGWKNESDMNLLGGVILPNALSFVILCFMFNLFNFLFK